MDIAPKWFLTDINDKACWRWRRNFEDVKPTELQDYVELEIEREIAVLAND